MKVLRIERENATFQVLQALKTNRQKRTKRGEIFVEGVAAINAAVACGLRAVSVAHAGNRRLSGWAHDTIERLGPDQLLVLSESLMSGISDRADPSELIVVLERPALPLAGITSMQEPFAVILDRPSNTGNLGSVIRSCNAFDVHLVITTGHGVDIYDPQVIRASLGAVFCTRVVHEPSTRELVAWLTGMRREHRELEVIGTDSAGSLPLRETALRKPVVLVFGNEATGISATLRNAVDTIISIPMGGMVNSLNLACAASIILYSVQ